LTLPRSNPLPQVNSIKNKDLSGKLTAIRIGGLAVARRRGLTSFHLDCAR
jgi:hypothetical protein